jgi:hypothetical protein
MGIGYSKEELLKRANSGSPVSGFSWNNVSATLLPNFSFDNVLLMVDNDPIASGAVQHFVDKCMEGDYSIIKRKDRSYDKSYEQRLVYDFKLDSLIRNVFLVGKLFNNVFIEIVRDGNGLVKDLNVLDSTIVEPVTKPNGDPKYFLCKVPDPETGVKHRWGVEEVVWVKFNNRDNGFAPVNIKSLWTVLNQKSFINRFVNWCWKTGQYRVIHNFKAADDKVVQDFVAYNAKVDNDFTKPFLSGGEYQRLMVRDMSEMGNLEAYLKYLDNQIVIALRIPPLDAGIPDASGRSNADAQGNNLVTHVSGWRLVVANAFNELFKKINKGSNALVFGPVDRFSERMVWENLQIMKSMGVSNDTCEEYLNDRGLFFEGKVFEDPIVLEDESVAGSPDNPRDLDTMPSRQGKAEGVGNSKIGTGEQGSTREDQLVKKSYKDYEFYDVVVQDDS